MYYALVVLASVAVGISIGALLKKAADKPDMFSGIEFMDAPIPDNNQEIQILGSADLCPNCDTLLTLNCHRCGYIRRGEIPFAEVEE